MLLRIVRQNRACIASPLHLASSYQTVLSRPVSKRKQSVFSATFVLRSPCSPRIQTSQRPLFSRSVPATGFRTTGLPPFSHQPFGAGSVPGASVLPHSPAARNIMRFAPAISASPKEARKQTPNGDSISSVMSLSSKRRVRSKNPSAPCADGVSSTQ